MKILLTGARIIDPSQKMDARMDILIEEGKIAKIGTISKVIKAKIAGKVKIIELTGMIVVPGLIDMHTHLREPGLEYKETIASPELPPRWPAVSLPLPVCPTPSRSTTTAPSPNSSEEKPWRRSGQCLPDRRDQQWFGRHAVNGILGYQRSGNYRPFR